MILIILVEKEGKFSGKYNILVNNCLCSVLLSAVPFVNWILFVDISSASGKRYWE